ERESGFLFPNDFLILDEAHTVEQTASRQIGTVVSQYLLRATVQRLYNARSKKGLLTVMRDATGVRLAAEIVDEIDKLCETLGPRPAANAFPRRAHLCHDQRDTRSGAKRPGLFSQSRGRGRSRATSARQPIQLQSANEIVRRPENA